MTEPKKPLSETAFDRKLDAKIKEIQDAQAARDAAQDAQLARPSVAMKAAKAMDVTLRYPIPFSVAGLAFIVLGVWRFEGAKMWTLVGIGVVLVPGLASKAVEFVAGLKKAKE